MNRQTTRAKRAAEEDQYEVRERDRDRALRMKMSTGSANTSTVMSFVSRGSKRSALGDLSNNKTISPSTLDTEDSINSNNNQKPKNTYLAARKAVKNAAKSTTRKQQQSYRSIRTSNTISVPIAPVARVKEPAYNNVMVSPEVYKAVESYIKKVSSKKTLSPTKSSTSTRALTTTTTAPAVQRKTSSRVQSNIKRYNNSKRVSVSAADPSTTSASSSDDATACEFDMDIDIDMLSSALRKESTSSIASSTCTQQQQQSAKKVPPAAPIKSKKATTVASTTTTSGGEQTYNAQVHEYSKEIHIFMRELEVKRAPLANYMDLQPELSWNMRKILINWVIQTHALFKFQPETLFQTINITDRFLSLNPIGVTKLQLVGLSSLLIAAKYEEINLPTMKELLYVSQDAYTPEDIVRSERYILKVLEWNVGMASPLYFMRRISRADGYDPAPRALCKYILEVAMLEHQFLNVSPSMMAAASMLVSLEILKKEWTFNIATAADYDRFELVELARLLLNTLETPENHQIIYEKYAVDVNHGASSYFQTCLKAMKKV